MQYEVQGTEQMVNTFCMCNPMPTILSLSRLSCAVLHSTIFTVSISGYFEIAFHNADPDLEAHLHFFFFYFICPGPRCFLVSLALHPHLNQRFGTLSTPRMIAMACIKPGLMVEQP